MIESRLTPSMALGGSKHRHVSLRDWYSYPRGRSLMLLRGRYTRSGDLIVPWAASLGKNYVVADSTYIDNDYSHVTSLGLPPPPDDGSS